MSEAIVYQDPLDKVKTDLKNGMFRPARNMLEKQLDRQDILPEQTLQLQRWLLLAEALLECERKQIDTQEFRQELVEVVDTIQDATDQQALKKASEQLGNLLKRPEFSAIIPHLSPLQEEVQIRTDAIRSVEDILVQLGETASFYEQKIQALGNIGDSAQETARAFYDALKAVLTPNIKEQITWIQNEQKSLTSIISATSEQNSLPVVYNKQEAWEEIQQLRAEIDILKSHPVLVLLDSNLFWGGILIAIVLGYLAIVAFPGSVAQRIQYITLFWLNYPVIMLGLLTFMRMGISGTSKHKYNNRINVDEKHKHSNWLLWAMIGIANGLITSSLALAFAQLAHYLNSEQGVFDPLPTFTVSVVVATILSVSLIIFVFKTKEYRATSKGQKIAP